MERVLFEDHDTRRFEQRTDTPARLKTPETFQMLPPGDPLDDPCQCPGEIARERNRIVDHHDVPGNPGRLPKNRDPGFLR